MAKPKKINTGYVSFLEFFLIWADMKGWEVPDVHIKMVNWLEHREGRNAVLQVWRGCGKSTIVGLYIAWKLRVNPEYRFIVLSASDVDAWKMSADAQNIIKLHPLCRGMAGDRVWQATIWSVEGNTDPRNSSVMSKGIMGNIVGSRADEILLDDVEVPRNVGSDEMRRLLRMRIDETTHVLVPGGKKLFIGTPHTFDSIYPEQIEKGATSLFLPLFDAEGRNQWPERFTPDEIEYRKNECITEGKWLSQYMLCPVPSSEIRLDPQKLQVFDDMPVIHKANGCLNMFIKIGDELRQMVGAACYWDVALGKVKSDDSVLALVLSDGSGRLYWVLAEELEGGIDSQCKQIAYLVEQYSIPNIIVETNGPGGFVPAILRKHLSNIRCGVTQYFAKTKKSERILDALEPALSGEFLYVHRTLINGKLVKQMREFNPENKHSHDDYLDAGAGAINASPVRIGRAFDREPREFSDWRPNAGTHEVKFELGW